MDKSERITEAFNYLRFNGLAKTQTEVAEKMETTRAAVSVAFKKPTDNFLKRFNVAFDNIFNINWLIYGNGEMLNVSKSETKYNIEQNIGSNINQGNSNTITTSANNDIVGRLLDELALQRQHSDTLAKQNQELIDLLRKKIDKE